MYSRHEKTDYFWEAFDSHLRAGLTGKEAIEKAAGDYRFVFFNDDDRTSLQRAASLALIQLRILEK